MAISVVHAVFALSDVVTPVERLVLLSLANHAHATGDRAFPAVGTIMAETSLKRRTVQVTLRRLAATEFITLAGRRSRGAMVYKLNLARLTDCARHARSRPHDCAPHAHAEKSSPNPEGRTTCASGAHHVRGGGAPHAPDPSVDPSIEPSEDQDPRSARVAFACDDENHGALVELAKPIEVSLARGEITKDEADEELSRRAAKARLRYGGDRTGKALASARAKRLRLESKGAAR